MLTSISLVCIPLTDTFARAGGGGGGWGGWGSGSGIALVIVGIYYAIYTIRRKKLLKKAQKNLEKAKAIDSSWNEDELKEITRKTFFLYQDAWMNKNLDSLWEYLSTDYLERAKTDMLTMLGGKKNIIKDPKIHSLNLISVKDTEGHEGDMFVMEVIAAMVDYTISEETGEFIESTLSRGKNEGDVSYQSRAKREKEEFTEFWTFIRIDGKWQLNDIKQGWILLSDITSDLTEVELKEILAKEEATEEISDEVFYNK